LPWRTVSHYPPHEKRGIHTFSSYPNTRSPSSQIASACSSPWQWQTFGSLHPPSHMHPVKKLACEVKVPSLDRNVSQKQIHVKRLTHCRYGPLSRYSNVSTSTEAGMSSSSTSLTITTRAAPSRSVARSQLSCKAVRSDSLHQPTVLATDYFD
jgi:hypothetical protein